MIYFDFQNFGETRAPITPSIVSRADVDVITNKKKPMVWKLHHLLINALPIADSPTRYILKAMYLKQ
jgi:hypothetical protein